jgi:hypothetical protein
MSNTPTPPLTQGGDTRNTMRLVFLIIFLVSGLLQIRHCVAKHRTTMRAAKIVAAQKAAAYVVAHPPAPIAPPVVKIGKEPITHQFDSTGCVEVWLEGNWVSYPQPLNAEIRFFDQYGRLVLKQGAKKQGSSLSSANYRICRAPGSDATGVQVWN